MNKTEKIICVLLGLVLAWYVFHEMPKAQQAKADAAKAALAAVAPGGKEGPSLTSGGDAASPGGKEGPSLTSGGTPLPRTGDGTPLPRTDGDAVSPSTPSVPEKRVVLENGQLQLELSSWGAVVTRATLKEYARDCGEITAENPAVTLDFASAPLGALGGVPSLAPNAAYEVRSQTSNAVVFANAAVTRTVTLGADYRVTFEEVFAAPTAGSADARPTTLSLGAMAMGVSKNDLLSVDSMACDAGKGKPGVIHHCEGSSPLKDYLVGGLSGGCSGSSSAAGMPAERTVPVPGAQTWIALKNRFFVAALASSSETVSGFDATVSRDMASANYRPRNVSAAARFAGVPAKRTSVFFVGPKKQALLWDLGMKDVMEFGMWRWLCYPLVWVLNLFNDWIPNYGIAIILLTILVRLVFWPLTHKSTVGMKKMQEIQPLMKEIQAKYKDNPQRLQQETWQLYKDKKVNPMSSCLPMLVQIPVFIALFNVLRSAVELRYAPFLWISDLSEPEALFASWFPFGGLNLLPILMAATTALQSAFTPSGGDARQQRMMMIMMPAMMLVMFYSFPSALSLYWFLSNIFSIVQMWLIRRQTAREQKALAPEVIDPPETRQMRRHQG